MNAKEMRAKRAALALQARGILDKAEAEKRDLSAEEQTNWDTIHADIDKLKGQIDRVERQEREELELRGSQGRQAGGQDGPPQDGEGGAGGGAAEPTAEQQAQLRQAAFRHWIRSGMAGLAPEHRAVMAQRVGALPDEARAMAAGIDTAGGYVVFDEQVNRVEMALKAFSGVRQTRATILRTNSGVPIPMPTTNDTSNKGALVGENVDVGTATDPLLGAKTLSGYMFTSKVQRVSLKFLQDNDLANAEEWVTNLLGERIARGVAPYFITGTGNSQPQGLAQSTTLGRTGTSQTLVTWDDFVELEHSVDPAYRAMGEYLVADGLLKAAKLLKDGEGRPLWVPGVAVRQPDTINGYRYAVDMEIPTPAAAAKTMYFGDFSKFHIRDVRGMQMLRLTERYAEFLQVGFILFSQHDSVLLDAGTNPIKHFVQAS